MENLKKLDKFTNKIRFYKRVECEIHKKMTEYFPEFKNSNVGLHYYDASYIIEFIIGWFKKVDEDSIYNLAFLRHDRSDKIDRIYFNVGGHNFHMGSVDEIDFEKYKKLLTEIVNDKSLKNHYNRYVDEC